MAMLGGGVATAAAPSLEVAIEAAMEAAVGCGGGRRLARPSAGRAERRAEGEIGREIGYRVALAQEQADLEARFAAFVEAHRERAVRLAWRLLRSDPDAAEDVAQEAFARAWKGLSRFRGEAALGTWFYRILVRQAASHRRFRGLRERFGGLGNPDAADPSPRPAGDPELRRRIARALDGLPRRQREVFALVHLEQFTVRETAEILGRSPGTVKSHLHRALQALRRDLHDLSRGAEPAGGESS